MPLTMPVCVQCGETVQRDINGWYCKCYQAQKQAVFRKVVEAGMRALDEKPEPVTLPRDVRGEG